VLPYGGVNLHETGPAQAFWALLTDDERGVLSGLGRVTSFAPGTLMCVEGEPVTHVFILVDGWVKIQSVTSEGRELVLALRGQGDVIGELAGETTGHRTASVQAIGTVRALIVGFEKFSSFLDSHLGAGHAYRRVFAQRWNDSESLLRSRSVTNGAQRLAGLLLDLAARHGTPAGHAVHVAMPLTQVELASMIGVSRATVTRALSNWRDRGIIRTGQRDLTIADLGTLRKIAGEQP
jgi:CRP/FNR family transcriptional regulator, cyclic AMP receptor protein